MEILATLPITLHIDMIQMQRHAPGHVARSVKIRRAIWNVTAALLFRPFITPVFGKWRIALLKLFGAKVEWDSYVYSSVRIWAPWLLHMGHKACLGPDVICYNQDWVVLEDDAVVSQYSYLCTAGHDVHMMNTADRSLITAPIIIRSKSWVGSRAFIGMGVEIGEGAVVGATASVYKSVEPWAVVGGNPAKTIKMRKIEYLKSGGAKFSISLIAEFAQAVPFEMEEGRAA